MIKQYKFSDPAFKDIDFDAFIPDRQEAVLELKLDCSDKLFNAVRREVMDDYPMLCLDYDEFSLDTKATNILRNVVYNHIRFIPVHQDIDPGETFSLSVANITGADMIVLSGHLKPESKHIPKKIPIAMLSPGEYMKIPEIKLKAIGPGDAAGSMCSDFEFKPLDYMDVCTVNYKCDDHTMRVAVADVLKHVKSTPAEIINSKILVIPTTTEYVMDPDDKARLEKHKDHIIHADIEAKSSLIHHSVSRILKFHLYGNIDPKSVLPKVKSHLITRLKAPLVSERKVVESHKNSYDLTIFTIADTQTITQLLVFYALELDPSIPYVADITDHDVFNPCRIAMMRADAVKFMDKVREHVIKAVEKL